MSLTEVTAPPAAVVTPDRPALGDEPGQRIVRRVDLPSVATVVAVAWWVVAAPRLWGGRGAGAVSVGAILTGLAVLALRPHRYLPRRITAAALAVSLAAVLVAVVSPTGWAGAATAAGYVSASWTVVAVAAGVVRRPSVREPVLLLVVIGAMVEVAEAWLAWWGGGTAAAPITGTFYWYDPFAAFLIAGTVIGLSLWLQRSRAVAALGLVGCVLGSIGLVYSTSRAADAVAAVAVLAVTAVYVWRVRLAGLPRVLAGLGVTAFAVWGIGGPPFFAHRALPFAATAARSAGQSLRQNGGYRFDFWREAFGVFERHPVTGGGYHSLATASIGHVPAGWPISPLAHNGYLQALADGGLLLGIPFLLAVAGLAWWLLRSLADAVRARDFSTAGFVVPLLLAGLLAHSAVDFDWSYAGDLLVAAVLAGLVVAARVPLPTPESARRPASRVLTGAVLAGVVLTGVAAQAAWSGDMHQSLPMPASGPSTSVDGGVR